MPAPTPDDIATRQSWKALPVPAVRTDLAFRQSYSPIDFERMKRGLIPHEMEDKWFIFFEEPWLFFHLSSTGACIYGVRFEPSELGYSAVESWASRDAEHYTEDDIDYERAVLTFLIERMLLGRPAPFPRRNQT